MAVVNVTVGERVAGLLLMVAAGLALLIANSPLAEEYRELLHTYVGPLSVQHWIADGLMAIFFLLVGLEVKREWHDGQLATPAAKRLPLIAAAAGMAVPALIYMLIIGGEPALSRGWAIPAATDIAFALGVLALLGARAPPVIKLLLVTIAIVDDIGAVVIIAIFYTADLNIAALVATAALVSGMVAMSKLGIRRLWPYLLGFLLLWLAVFQSGVHATIAGVLAALTVPLGIGESHSPLKRLEHAIHPWVMFGIIPLFGFASAGVTLTGLDALFSPLPLAIALGLFLGKQSGVFGATWLADRIGIAPKPPHLKWQHIYAASVLCGIGFTMSLFIGALAYSDAALVDAAKIGTLAGSLVSGVVGFVILRLAPPVPETFEDRDEAEEVFGEDYPEDPVIEHHGSAAGPAATG